MDAGLGVGVALHADGLAGTFAGAGVGLGALAADREAAQMADATVALDALEALQVHTDFAAEIAFDDVLAILDGVHDLRELSFAQVFRAHCAIDARAFQNLFRIHRADSVDITKRDIDALLRGNVHT